ncbi:MAG: UDP-N-acetylglucosamine 2-epimerase (non-hydrolyzing), partial [Candidatus Staskawiczbacteria bacterium]
SKEMPEEINRILTDHCSDFVFAPTKGAKNNLLNEGISEKKIFTVGNTIVDAVKENLKLAENESKILKKLNLKNKNYCLLTLHRQENVDKKERLKKIFQGLDFVYKKFGLKIIFPIHPRAKKMISEFKLKIPKGIGLIEPQGYLDFLQLEANAKLAITDSGGVQEEACILKVPCVTLRDNTERPETIEVGANVLAGADPDKILQSVKKMISKKNNWKNPFGDGESSVKIIKSILQEYEAGE